jgi:hypothetical protein
LIYKGFLGAWLSVNQGFSGQNLGQRECLFFIIYGTLDRTVGSVELDKKIEAAANKLRDCFAQ